MATPGGREGPPLARKLFEEPYRFDFFQAVRLLARMRPGRDPVGVEGHPGREVVRFRTFQSLAFPPSELHSLAEKAGPGGVAATDAPPELTVAFMGLTGPIGVLPPHYTEMLMARRRAGDPTLAAFFDLFNHRMISLFFRAWEKYRPALARERGEEDLLARCLFALMGLGTASLRDRHEFPDGALLFHAGTFARRTRPAVSLEAVLRDTFGLEVEVEPFIGRWLALDPADRSSLAREGPNNALGSSMMLGGRFWDVRGTFRLRVGPLTFAQFLAYSPDGAQFRALAQLARLFADGELDFDVKLVLKAEEVPDCRLSAEPGAGARLGRYAWLKSRPLPADAEEAIFPSGC